MNSDKSFEKKYPTHHEYKVLEDQMHSIRDFIEWVIHETRHGPPIMGELRSVLGRVSDTYKAELIMGFFGLDYHEFQREKDAMVQELIDKTNKEQPYAPSKT